MTRTKVFVWGLACALTAGNCAADRISASQSRVLRATAEFTPSPVESPQQQRIGLYSVQSTTNWNLDVVDGVMDGVYNYPDGATGAGVDVYVVDTGVYKDHPEFGGRVVAGKNYASSDACDFEGTTYTQWDGHGTHVAGIIGSATYGVAKDVRIIDVRVLDNCGYGDTDVATAALRWVIRNHRASRVAIVNMSLGAPADNTTVVLENATRDLLRDNIIPVIAAGNEGDDACNSSPAKVGPAITVGAVRRDGSSLLMAGYSNYGACVDLLAPGSGIWSTWNNYRPSAWTASLSGTSMATPLVAGIAALVAQRYPNRCAASVRDAVIAAGSASFAIQNLVGVTPDLLAQLNLDVIPSRSVPGNVTTVIPVATASRTITVGWDRPCSGGTPILDYLMNVYRDGVFARQLTLPGNINNIVIHNLINGSGYTFDLVARNARGSSTQVSGVSMAAVTGALGVGITRARPVLDVVGVASAAQVSVTAASAQVCKKVNVEGWKILGLARGTCTIRIRPLGAWYSYTRSITVT